MKKINILFVLVLLSFCSCGKKEGVPTKTKSASYYHSQGLKFYNQGKYQKAIDEWFKEIKLKPQNANAYNNIGIAYKEMGEYDKAIEMHKKALEINPKFTHGHYSLGLALIYKKEFRLALWEFMKVIEINPKYREAHYNLAVCYTNMRLAAFLPNAIKECEEELKINPKHQKSQDLMERLRKYAKSLEKTDLRSGPLFGRYSFETKILFRSDEQKALSPQFITNDKILFEVREAEKTSHTSNPALYWKNRIFTMNVDGTNKVKIVDENCGETTLSPDKKSIVYNAYQLENKVPIKVDIWLTNINGSKKRKLTDDGKSFVLRKDCWSSDSKKVYFAEGIFQTGMYDEWIPKEWHEMNLAEKSLKKLSEKPVLDKKRLITLKRRKSINELYYYDFYYKNNKVFETPRIFYDSDVVWKPDYVWLDNNKLIVQYFKPEKNQDQGTFSLYLLDITTLEKKLLIEDVDSSPLLTISPNKKFLCYVKWGRICELWIAKIDGSQKKCIWESGQSNEITDIVWSPENDSFIFVVSEWVLDKGIKVYRFYRVCLRK